MHSDFNKNYGAVPDRYAAALVGWDSRSDIAVIKVEADGLSAAILDDSVNLVVGELAVAIGNPLGQPLPHLELALTLEV